jgi:hypothetical protein
VASCRGVGDQPLCNVGGIGPSQNDRFELHQRLQHRTAVITDLDCKLTLKATGQHIAREFCKRRGSRDLGRVDVWQIKTFVIFDETSLSRVSK